MERFWAFLRANIIFTIFAAVFGVKVMLQAIPIIIGISLGVKGLFALLHKKK